MLVKPRLRVPWSRPACKPLWSARGIPERLVYFQTLIAERGLRKPQNPAYLAWTNFGRGERGTFTPGGRGVD